MDVASVTLDEVLAAAQTRAASLVPETSGYFALAVADASARLPYLIEDGMVVLTTEGTVKVARGATVVGPAESAAVLRDALARLLACSIGSMPALTTAARPRPESDEGVDALIRELEAALIPVNRAAARRALARLARETSRARDSGSLRRKRRAGRARSERPAPAPIAAQVWSPPPAPTPASRQDEARKREALKPPPPTPEELDAIDVDVAFEQAVEPAPASPVPQAAAAYPLIDDAATTVDAATTDRPRRQARAMREPAGGAALGACTKSDVEDLLDRFVVSTLAAPDSLAATRASLKRLAGLEPTPPPPTVAEIQRIQSQLGPPRTRHARAERSMEPDLLAPVTSSGLSWGAGGTAHAEAPGRLPWALVAVGLILAGILGHFLPTWFA